MPRTVAFHSPLLALAVAGAAVGFSSLGASGQTWSSSAASDVGGTVLGLKSWDPDGAGPMTPVVVAFGTFATAGGSAAGHCAIWDGSAWSSFGGAGLTFSGSSGGIALLPSNNNLFFAGTGMTSADGTPTKGVAGWDGSSWFGLDSSTVTALVAVGTASADTIVVTGAISTVNGVSAKNVAVWNTSTGWAALGDGVSSIGSSCIGLANGNIVVSHGGEASGPPSSIEMHRIGRWDGSAWHQMGLGFTSTNTTLHPQGIARCLLEMPNGDVIAGGSFVMSGAANLNKVARWDHATDTWMPMGSGINNDTGANHDVYALALMQNGDVVAGGDFTTAIGAPRNYLARWNPTTQTWSAMASGDAGVDGPVRALAALPNGDLAVGGDFANAGGQAAARFAIWHEPGVAETQPQITVEPTTQYICIFPGGVGQFHLEATGGNLHYQWQQQDLGPTFPDYIDISDGPVPDIFGHPIFTAAGTNTDTLTLSDGAGFGQEFRCRVSNSAGQVDSAEVAMLYCQADINCSGSVEVQDIFDFLGFWFAGSAEGDFNHNDTIEVQDIFDFLSAWFEGCH